MTTTALYRRGGPLGELAALLRRLSAGWKGGRRPILAVVASLAVALAAVGQHNETIRPVLDRLGAERANLPFAIALFRLPLSVIVSSPSLPAWGAALQVFVLFGIGELLFGWRKTLTVGMLSHATATLSARLMIAVGSGPFWLPERYHHMRDTGPSAAVVGIAVYVLVKLRWPWTLAATVGVMVAELYVIPNLAGREHIAAIIAGVVIAVAEERVQSMRRARRSVQPASLVGEPTGRAVGPAREHAREGVAASLGQLKPSTRPKHATTHTTARRETQRTPASRYGRLPEDA